jgi:signal transduction histidine kinase
VVAVAGITGGVAVDGWAFGVDQPLLWIPDLGVGVVLIVVGTSVAARARGAGVLFTAAGLAWFAGTVVPVAAYWHRGVLVHLLVAYPGIRPVSRTGWVLVGAGYTAAVVGPVWGDDATGLVVGSVALGVAFGGFRRALVRRLRSRQLACMVGAGVSAVVVLGSVARLAVPAGTAALPSLLAYEAALVVAAGFLWWGLRPVGVGAVTDLVVELGGDRSAPLRDALVDLLGDPAARLGYWHTAQAAYVDVLGEVLREPAAGAGLTLTRVDRDGRRFAALLHDSAVAAGRAAHAVAAADRLMSAHVALQADIQDRVAEVSASRRRLQRAVDGERHRLERRLATAAESRLVGLVGDLRGIASDGDTHLVRALDQLERAIVDLHDVQDGLFPRELAGGLSSAVAALASRCPVPVRLSVPGERFDPEVETAAYYLCAEALTNVAKHALASVVRIDVTVRSGVLLVAVADDGVGGAAVAGGTGILGLMDRVESIGGTLRVDSGPGAGTRLAAEFPLDGQPR